MKEFKIYTAGKMSGLSYQEQMNWRKEIEWAVEKKTNKKVHFIHPPVYYNYENQDYKSEKEIKDWEINQVRNSDIVIVNLDEVNDSVGTHYELCTVDAINSFGNKHIFVIGIGKLETSIHPWIQLSIHRQEETFEDAADYIVNYLLL